MATPLDERSAIVPDRHSGKRPAYRQRPCVARRAPRVGAALAARYESSHNIMAMAKRRNAKTEVGAAEFKARCLELVDHVRESRAEYVVTRHGKPVARLAPVRAAVPASPLGTMRGTLLKYD